MDQGGQCACEPVSRLQVSHSAQGSSVQRQHEPWGLNWLNEASKICMPVFEIQSLGKLPAPSASPLGVGKRDREEREGKRLLQPVKELMSTWHDTARSGKAVCTSQPSYQHAAGTWNARSEISGDREGMVPACRASKISRLVIAAACAEAGCLQADLQAHCWQC